MGQVQVYGDLGIEGIPSLVIHKSPSPAIPQSLNSPIPQFFPNSPIPQSPDQLIIQSTNHPINYISLLEYPQFTQDIVDTQIFKFQA